MPFVPPSQTKRVSCRIRPVATIKICVERIPRKVWDENSLGWWLGWRWEWWLEGLDDVDFSLFTLYGDAFLCTKHSARSRELALKAGRRAIVWIHNKEGERDRIKAERAASHECIDP